MSVSCSPSSAAACFSGETFALDEALGSERKRIARVPRGDFDMRSRSRSQYPLKSTAEIQVCSAIVEIRLPPELMSAISPEYLPRERRTIGRSLILETMLRGTESITSSSPTRSADSFPKVDWNNLWIYRRRVRGTSEGTVTCRKETASKLGRAASLSNSAT